MMELFNFNDKEGQPFVVVSGEFLKSGAALPFGNRRVMAAALREFYLYKGKSFGSKAKINLLQIFNFAFVWRLIFRKKFFIDQNEEIFPFLRSKINAEEPIIFSIYTGSRKYILPLFGGVSGNLLGVAKVYFPKSADYGENEARTLDYLQELDLPHFSFPKVLAKDHFRDSLVVMLSSLPGLQRITARCVMCSTIFQHSAECWNIVGRCRKTLQSPHLDFLKQLSKKTGSESIFSQSEFYKIFNEETEFLRSKILDKFSLVDYFYKKISQNLANKKFIFALTKREFPFFEMLCVSSPDRPKSEVRSPKFFIIDWEQARFGFPPIFDVFSLLMSSSRFKKGNYVELYKKNAIDLFFSENIKTKKALREMLEFWNLSGLDAYHLFLLYLIDQLYIHLHVDHAPSAERIIALLHDMRNNEERYLKNWILN